MSKMQDYLGSLQKLLQQSNALELQLEHVFDKVDDVLLSIDSEDIKAKIESKILKGADQRDPDKIYDFFDTVYSCSNPDDTWIPQFCDRFGVHPAEARDWIQQLDCRDDGALDRAGFARIAAFQSSTARWASTLPLAEILGDALGALVPDPPDYLEQLASLDHGVVHLALDCFASALRRLVATRLDLVRQGLESARRWRDNAAGRKFEVRVNEMSAGGVDDFHGGLDARVGHVTLKFDLAMEREHRSTKTFLTPNYHVETQPAVEWLLVKEREGKGDEEWATICAQRFPQVGLGPSHHGRRIPDVAALLQLPICREANLTRIEAVAVVQYTGPMFFLYNTILRRFPAALYEDWKDVSRFTTTIHVLVSAVQKLTRTARLPEGQMLYRGLGGTLDLPERFRRGDQQGRRGYAEWGFMSTTADIKVAEQYSGVREGKPRATVLAICTGAVDRGACIQELSQYVDEKEILFLPLSFLQPDGQPFLQANLNGMILMVPIRVIPNLKALTVEEAVAKKKAMHLAAFEFLVAETREELMERIQKHDALERFDRDPIKAGFTLERLVESILNESSSVLEKHKQFDVHSYSHDEEYRGLVVAMLDVKNRALAKLRLYLEDHSQMITYFVDVPAAAALRDLFSFYLRRIRSENDLSRRSLLAMEACRMRGLVRELLDERDEGDEIPLVKAAADGAGHGDLQLLVMAHDTSETEEFSEALRKASRFGHSEAVELLVEAKANIDGADQVSI
mmetsp:Transcript_64520/g.172798  ORF Transcript_64520/g.172798 Transcript_64520/m.172798 type:complete len:740 (+) Transcript_64520:143-2362(+)